MTNGYDAFLRRTNMVVLSNTTPVWTNIFTYDAASRLATVSDGTNSAAYSYLANSPLVSQITFKQSGTTRMTTTKQYDLLNRLTSIGTTNAGSATICSSAYGYNSANQRTAMTNADGSYWVYGYDSLGQVISAVKYWSDGTPAPGEQFGNAFDDIGNRINSQMGGNANGFGLRNANYTANDLNQYTSRTVPGAVDILGSATNTATVTVNGVLAYRHGSNYEATLPISNAGNAVWQLVTNEGVLGASTNTDATITGSLFLPQNPENFSYDPDGNLISDGRFTNVWDAENRLIGMTNIANIATAGKYALSIAYDYQGRRIQKIVYTNSGSAWIASYTNKFIYDGWNLVAILDGGNNLLDSFVWGNDLSGSQQGAGGVGGLISMTVYSGANTGTYFYCYDGNGNVMALVNASNGAIAGQYEYGPFGEVVRATGPMAFVNPFRFSTKYEDDETGIIMYPHRPYNPSTGRFLTRDPLGEQSFFIARLRRDRKHAPELWHESLKPGYVFVSNDAVDYIDPLGLNVYKVQTASSHSGSIVDHRQIVGDDGNGGCYVLEYWAKSCSCGLFGATLVGPGELEVTHDPSSASDYIRANGLKIVGTVETDNVWFYPASNGSVDSALSRDADGDNVLHQGTYILGWHDCGTIANQWMAHAREVLKQAENSAPGGGDSPDPFGTPGWGF